MTRPFLLDTVICVWWMEGRLPRAAEAGLVDAFNAGIPSFVSPITALEAATAARKGRLKFQVTPQRWFEALMSLPGLTLAPMPPALLIQSQALPGDIHKDPADRIIAATAREYGY